MEEEIIIARQLLYQLRSIEFLTNRIYVNDDETKALTRSIGSYVITPLEMFIKEYVRVHSIKINKKEFSNNEFFIADELVSSSSFKDKMIKQLESLRFLLNAFDYNDDYLYRVESVLNRTIDHSINDLKRLNVIQSNPR